MHMHACVYVYAYACLPNGCSYSIPIPIPFYYLVGAFCVVFAFRVVPLRLVYVRA